MPTFFNSSPSFPEVAQELTEAETCSRVLDILKNGDFQQRWEVCKLFPGIGNQVIPDLIELLHQQDCAIETRWFSARILSQYREPAAICALAQLLQEDNPEELRQTAAELLASMGESALHPLIDLLQNPPTRLLSLQALAQICSPAIIAPLLPLTEDIDPQVRTLALKALGVFHEPSIFPVLVKGLADPVVRVKKEALQALGYWHEAAAILVPLIKPLLREQEPEICQQAAITLGKLGTEAAAEALGSVLSTDVSTEQQQVIVKALGWMEIPLALDHLALGLWESEPWLCVQIITILGRQPRDSNKAKIMEILANFINSDLSDRQTREVKQSLAMALGELRQPQSAAFLRDLSEDKDIQVRLHAQAALRKLSRQLR